MVVLSTAVLSSLYLPGDGHTDVAIAAFAIFAVAGQRLFGRRERFLLLLAAGLTALAWTAASDPLALYFRALEQAVFLAAFMILLALLREGAVTSPSVLAVGAYLTRQPPSRRYLSIAVGGHVLSLLLNFGALNLLGPLIMRGIAARTTDPRVARVRLERQISALMRGFALMVIWSPTAITQALIFAVIPAADHGRMIAIGLAVVVAAGAVGWAWDGVTGMRARRLIPASARPQYVAGEPVPAGAFRDFAVICTTLALTTVLIMNLSDVATVPALMLAAPLITGLWLVRQTSGLPDRLRQLRARLAAIALGSVPQGSPEAFTLSCAGYSGIVAAGMIDPEQFARTVDLSRWSGPGFYAAAMLLPLAFSNIGLPPMITTTFLGTLLVAVPGLDFDPTLLAMAFCVGWALNLTGSPFGVSAVILSRVAGVPAPVLTWRWNGVYTASVAVVSLLILALAPRA